MFPIGISDHSLTIVNRDKICCKQNAKYLYTRSFKNFNEEKFCDDLKNMPWDNLKIATDIDTVCTAFNHNVSSVINKHAPLQKKRVKGKKVAWITKELLDGIKERDYLKKVASRTSNQTDWSNYKCKRNEINNLKNRLKQNHYKGKINEHKSKSKRLWKIFKRACSK